MHATGPTSTGTRALLAVIVVMAHPTAEAHDSRMTAPASRARTDGVGAVVEGIAFPSRAISFNSAAAPHLSRFDRAQLRAGFNQHLRDWTFNAVVVPDVVEPCRVDEAISGLGAVERNQHLHRLARLDRRRPDREVIPGRVRPVAFENRPRAVPRLLEEGQASTLLHQRISHPRRHLAVGGVHHQDLRPVVAVDHLAPGDGHRGAARQAHDETHRGRPAVLIAIIASSRPALGCGQV